MKIYLDTNSWVRQFEVGTDLVNNQCNAVGDILNNKFEIISSKFQLKQLSHLTRNESDFQKKINFQCAKESCETFCPKSIKQFIPCTKEVDQLLQKTMMNDREDAFHIIIAALNNVKFFVTTDDELYSTKKNIIEREVSRIVPPGINSDNLKIVDPIQFKNIMSI